MLKRCSVMVCLLGLCMVGVAAQPGQDEAQAPEAEKADAAPPRPAAKPRPAVVGDVIHLKTGKELGGVQVLRETPTTVTIRVMEGMTPMNIPRKYVTSITYDSIDPNKEQRRKARESESAKPSIILGKQVDAEFSRKLNQPLSKEEPLVFENQGFVLVLKALAEKAGVTVEVADPAQQVPQNERFRTFTVEPGTSLFSFLQEGFARAFPQLYVDYQYAKIVVTTRAAMEAAKTQQKLSAPPSTDNASPGG